MKKVIAIGLTALLVVSLLVTTLFVGQALDLSALGTLNATTPSSINDELSLTKYDITDKDSAKQLVYALEFNPKTSDLIPFMYHVWNGSGAAVLTDGTNAETKLGVDVVAGVNADFFAMASGAYGVANNMYVSNGKIATDSCGSGSNQLAFDSVGNASVVYSQLGYKIVVNDSEWTIVDNNVRSSALGFINKRSTTWSNRIYYYDSSCGTKTDSVDPGIEVVVTKLNGTDLVVNGILQGEVVEVRKDSKNSSFDPDQFILYIKNDSPLKADAEALVAGDKINIEVNETSQTSKTIMGNALTTIPVPMQMVKDGAKLVGTTSFNAYGLSLTESAQRTMVGVKADGSVVVAICDGRNVKSNDVKGFTLDQAAEYMLAMGCVDAFNLDGGGSTQMIKENSEGTLENVYTNGRTVANSLLIVKRKAVAEELKTSLQTLIDKADTDYPTTMPQSVNATYLEAKALMASTKAMPGDFTNMISRMESVFANDGNVYENIALGKPYTRSAVHTGNYADTDNKELTDGVMGNVGYGAEWVGWYKGSAAEVKNYATIDLGNVEEFSAIMVQFLSDAGAGVNLPVKFEIFISSEDITNPQNFTSIKIDTSLKAILNSNQEPGSSPGNPPYYIRELQNAFYEFDGTISARHVKFELTQTHTFNFISEILVLKPEAVVKMVEDESEPEVSEPEVSEPVVSEPAVSEPEVSEEVSQEISEEASSAVSADVSVPDTGDDTNTAVLVLLAFLAVTSGAVIYKRTKTR